MVSSYPVSRFFADSLTGHDVDVLIYLRTITISRKRITSVFVRQKKERGRQRKPGDAKKNRGDKQLRQLKQEDIKKPGDAKRKLEAAKMNVQKRRNNGKKRSGVEKRTPGVENKRPGVGKERPGVEKKKPGVEKERPDVEKKKPGIEKKRLIELPRR